MSAVRIGVLALQGDFREHLAALSEIGVVPVPVRRSDELNAVDGLVIPGGESTTMSRLLGVVGGTGDQDVIRLAAIGPDAVALTLASSGGFAFGDSAFTSAPNDRVLAVLGI